jgi:hypothetical protein
MIEFINFSHFFSDSNQNVSTGLTFDASMCTNRAGLAGDFVSMRFDLHAAKCGYINTIADMMLPECAETHSVLERRHHETAEITGDDAGGLREHRFCGFDRRCGYLRLDR